MNENIVVYCGLFTVWKIIYRRNRFIWFDFSNVEREKGQSIKEENETDEEKKISKCVSNFGNKVCWCIYVCSWGCTHPIKTTKCTHGLIMEHEDFSFGIFGFGKCVCTWNNKAYRRPCGHPHMRFTQCKWKPNEENFFWSIFSHFFPWFVFQMKIFVIVFQFNMYFSFLVFTKYLRNV